MEEERRRARARARRGCGSRNTSSSKKTTSGSIFRGPPDARRPIETFFGRDPTPENPVDVVLLRSSVYSCQVSLSRRRLAPLHATPVNSARTMRSAAAFRDVRVAAPAHGSASRVHRGAVRPRAADPRSVIHNTDADDTSSATFRRRLSLAASTAFGAASLAAPALADELSSVDLSTVDSAVAGWPVVRTWSSRLRQASACSLDPMRKSS